MGDVVALRVPPPVPAHLEEQLEAAQDALSRLVDAAAADAGRGPLWSAEEPCFACPCCELWSASLAQLHAAVVAHNAANPRSYPCSDDCLVCQVAAWSRS